MVVTCTIDFDENPFGTYFAGQVLTGKITLTSDKPKQVRGISLRIIGYAHTRWEESCSTTSTDVHGRSTTTTSSTDYTGHEDYIASLTYLLGSNESNDSAIIQPGIHTYNFACHLPLTCPSSFEGFYGHVRYLIKVALIRPWKFDQTYTKGFTVLKVMNLNYDSPLLRVAVNSDMEKVFCCGPCKTGPLQLHMSVPQGGYVPGQVIPVNVIVTNETNIQIQELKLELVMLVCYYSQYPVTQTRSERIVVTKHKGEPVLRHCKKVFNYELPVPATPPTCFNLCRIIQIAYQIELEAKVKGWNANQVLCLPITIGNVPLMDIIQQQPTSSMQRDFVEATVATEKDITNMEASDKTANVNGITATQQPLYASTPTPPWAADANIPPPSYEAAVHMRSAKINADEAHDYGQSDFAPRYPVFSLPTPSAPVPNGTEDDFVNDARSPNATWL